MKPQANERKTFVLKIPFWNKEQAEKGAVWIAKKAGYIGTIVQEDV